MPETPPSASTPEPREPAKAPPDQKSPGGKTPSKFHWTRGRVILLAVIVVAVAIAVMLYLHHAAQHSTSDDAFTAGFEHVISSRVTGNVVHLRVVDNQFVHRGQVLVELDPRDYQIQVEKAQANFDRANSDFLRVAELKDDVAISKQDYDQTKSARDVARAELEDANNQLSYCTIVSPSDGYVGHRTVEEGNRVTVGGALMLVVQDLWVVANYKETQLGKMKKNQRVTIKVDAVPDHTFTGIIDSFAPGTGATFTLLPPDNATGNFTKIVQRVPVKILFDPGTLDPWRDRLMPGLSVETDVLLDPNVQPVGDQSNKEGH